MQLILPHINYRGIGTSRRFLYRLVYGKEMFSLVVGKFHPQQALGEAVFLTTPLESANARDMQEFAARIMQYWIDQSHAVMDHLISPPIYASVSLVLMLRLQKVFLEPRLTVGFLESLAIV